MTNNVALTPLDPDKTGRVPGRSGRSEIWEATSTDGRWRYVRLELAGTPWEVTDLSDDTVAPDWFGTLAKARAWTAEQPPKPREPMIDTETEATPFAEWVIIELFGHRRLGGYLTEQEIAGQGFLRLDVPGDRLEEAGEPTTIIPAASQLYNPKSVYCITPTTEDLARAVARSNRPAPVQRWELPREITAGEENAGMRAAAGFVDDDGSF